MTNQIVSIPYFKFLVSAIRALFILTSIFWSEIFHSDFMHKSAITGFQLIILMRIENIQYWTKYLQKISKIFIRSFVYEMKMCLLKISIPRSGSGAINVVCKYLSHENHISFDISLESFLRFVPSIRSGKSVNLS